MLADTVVEECGLKVKNMTVGRPTRLIFGIALPLMLGNICQQLYTVVDASVVGIGIGMSALAALGAADWFNWLFVSMAQGMAQGFTIPMAQAFGAEDYPELRRCVGSAVILAAIASVVITVLAIVLIRPVLALLQTPLDIRPMSVSYLTALFAGLPVVMAYNLLAGILRALGDGRSPLYAMIVAAVTNIALDVLFVMGFHWGVASAAVATVIAQLCSCVFCLFRLRQVEFLRLRREDFRLAAERCGHLIRMGLPVSLQNAIIAVGGMIVQRVVNPLGVTFIAGYTATNKLYGVLEVAAISYGYAMSTYSGQNLGARKIDRIGKGVRAGVITGVLTALVIAAAMFLFGEQIVGMFIDAAEANAAEATRIACEFLYVMSAFLPVLYVLHVIRSTLQGMGNAIMPMVSGLAEFVMRTGAALLLPALIGYWGVFYAEVLAWAGADVILIASFFVSYSRLRRLYLPAERAKEGQAEK